MVFTKFLGIVLACYAVYYLFIVVVDLIKSKTATAADGKGKHAVKHLNIPENRESEKVSRSTHLNHSGSSRSDKNTEQENEEKKSEHGSKIETTENLVPPARENPNKKEDEGRKSKSAADILDSNSLAYINTQTEQFNLGFAERTGEGFEVSPENVPQITN